jgi:hypothetical protein
MSFIGFLLCIIWYLIIKRGLSYERYWVYSAREIEEQFLSIPLKTISRGGTYSDGECVFLGKKEGIVTKEFPLQIKPRILGKTIRTGLLINSTILIFTVVHFLIMRKCWPKLSVGLILN